MPTPPTWDPCVRLDAVLRMRRPLRTVRPRSVARRILMLLYALDGLDPDAVTLDVFDALHAVARLPWLRPACALPRGSPRPARVLLDHLLRRVPGQAPEVLYRCALQPSGLVSTQAQAVSLLAASGRGERLRDLPGLPPLTHRERHLLWTLDDPPGHLIAAARRAQVLAAGGGLEVARALEASRLIRLQPDEAWWRRAIHWMIDVELPAHELQRYTDWLWGLARGGEPVPRRRDLGRVLDAILGWEARHLPQPTLRPDRQGFPEVDLHVEPLELGGHRWTLHQLRTEGALRAEGRAMRHCVASYADAAARGRCSLWSLQRDGARALTLELQRWDVLQARGRRDRPPSKLEWRVLRHWAQTLHLRIVSV